MTNYNFYAKHKVYNIQMNVINLMYVCATYLSEGKKMHCFFIRSLIYDFPKAYKYTLKVKKNMKN